MIVEGKNAVAELLKSGGAIEKIVIDRRQSGDLVEQIKKSGVKYQFVENTKYHQGFAAFITEFKYTDIKQMVDGAYERGTQPVLLLLDGVEDPHNLGNIIRTAECMGVSGIVIPKNRSVGVTDTVVRVSAGAAAHMPIAKVTNINHEIESLKKQGFWIYAADMNGTQADRVNLTGAVAIVMGGEGVGVRELTRKLVDEVVSVPMSGKVNSLNVGAATAMVLYEVNRQRRAKQQ